MSITFKPGLFAPPVLAFVLILSIAGGCSLERPGQAAKNPVRIAVNIWPGYAHAFLAAEKNIFRDNGVEVELVLTRDINDSVRMYREGAVDGLFDGFPDLVMLNSEGFPARAVYVADFSDDGDAIVARPEVEGLHDLRGRTVGFTGFNTFSHIFVLKALERAGVAEGEAQFEIVPAMDVLDALDSGVISAGHTWEPVLSRALRKGYRVVAKAGDFPGVITDVLAFNPSFIADRPEDVKRIVRSLLAARDLVYSEREEAVRVMAAREGMSVEEMERGIEGVAQPGLAGNLEAMSVNGEGPSLYASGGMIARFFMSRGQISMKPEIKDLVEPAFVRELSEEAAGGGLREGKAR